MRQVTSRLYITGCLAGVNNVALTLPRSLEGKSDELLTQSWFSQQVHYCSFPLKGQGKINDGSDIRGELVTIMKIEN